MKAEADDKAKYAGWSQRKDIKAELKVSVIILLTNNDYPPVDRDEVLRAGPELQKASCGARENIFKLK